MDKPPEHDSRKETAEEFLSRWSRRKREAREAPAAVVPIRPADAAPPPLPALETLTSESDFTGFLHPRVDEQLRRAALKKLFSDPHFNVMDGLDVYIDDYSRDDPIPEAMMKELRHAQDILRASRERREEEARREAQRRLEAGLSPAADGRSAAPEPAPAAPPQALSADTTPVLEPVTPAPDAAPAPVSAAVTAATTLEAQAPKGA
jgi:hypothetical protein